MATVELKNPKLKEEVGDVDVLYHLALKSDDEKYYKETFGDTKFVIMGGAAGRMRNLALMMAQVLNRLFNLPVKKDKEGKIFIEPINVDQNRYSMFKVGPVVSVNHGMGMPSMSILLHEMTKLMNHAGATDVEFIRMGTSGGVGLEAGTVVIANEGVAGDLRSVRVHYVLGEAVERSTVCDPGLSNAIMEAQSHPLEEIDEGKGKGAGPNFPVTRGKTMGTDDFYEGQARLDGAICEYTKEDKMAFLKKLSAAGVKNIEMEGPEFTTFARRLNIRGSVVCVTLLNRLFGDQVDIKDWYAEYNRRTIAVVLRYVVYRLRKEGFTC